MNLLKNLLFVICYFCLSQLSLKSQTDSSFRKILNLSVYSGYSGQRSSSMNGLNFGVYETIELSQRINLFLENSYNFLYENGINYHLLNLSSGIITPMKKANNLLTLFAGLGLGLTYLKSPKNDPIAFNLIFKDGLSYKNFFGIIEFQYIKNSSYSFLLLNYSIGIRF